MSNMSENQSKNSATPANTKHKVDAAISPNLPESARAKTGDIITSDQSDQTILSDPIEGMLPQIIDEVMDRMLLKMEKLIISSVAAAVVPLNNIIQEQGDRIANLEEKLQDVTERCTKLATDNERIQQDVNDQEAYGRRNNIRISGSDGYDFADHSNKFL